MAEPLAAVVVTGAASGIGAACAARLAAQGYTVLGVDLHGVDIHADLGTSTGRRDAIAAVRTRASALVGLVTCAGLAGSPERAGSLVASVNYFGTVELLGGLRPLLVAGTGDGGPGQGRASAVAISSNSTTVQPAIPLDVVEACLAGDEERARSLADEAGSMVTYPASKLALAWWVRRHATGPDWAGSGVRLNAVAPGMIETPMVQQMRADPHTGPMLDMLPIPIGRPGRPEEIAAVVSLLLGPEGGYFCGSVLFCDGGSDAVLRTRDWPAAWDISVRDLGRTLTS